MHITFYGAVREVTGSLHLLSAGDDQVLMDCGMFQGRRRETDRKNRMLPFDPVIVTNMILSHAHIDHSGRIPLLTKNGFTGRIFSTRATADACRYLLPDSAHIQESDANYLNYKMVRNMLTDMASGKNKDKKRAAASRRLKTDQGLNLEAIHELIAKYHLEAVAPIYSSADAEAALSFFDGRPYEEPFTLGHGTECCFYDAGHILGSAISIIHATENSDKRTIGFTGDLGRFNKPILKDPTLRFRPEDRDLDLLIMESTYGDREHEPVKDMAPHLKQVLNETIERGGTVVIPSFAFGRTQELLYVIHDLYNNKEVPEVPVYVDSPLATRITQVFGEHPEMYDRQTHADFLEAGKNPFMFKKVQFVTDVADSMALMRREDPHIVISASGMCEGGRILHHLRYKIHNPKHTILIVGYMAAHTLGRRLLEKGEEYAKNGRQGEPPMLRFLNKEYPLKAEVVKLGGFSAHADRNEMLNFLKESNLRVKKIALVHGEEAPTLAFADTLKEAGHSVVVPRAGQTLKIP
ncbi:MAG: MBL fold metallo-hydrolase RNA specificity domain-containing protein [Desulfobacterales bacterium]